MTHYSLIQQVSTSLKDTLSPMLGGTDTRFVDPTTSVVAANDIVFDSPAELTLGANSMLSVFLYAVTPNPHMRNLPVRTFNTHDVDGNLLDSGGAREQDILLDFYYMITPYGQNRNIDYEITERIVQLFHRYPSIAQTAGALFDNGNDEIFIEPQSLTLDEMNKIWSVFPNKAYRMSLFYQVPSVMIAAAKPEATVYRWKKNTVNMKQKKN